LKLGKLFFAELAIVIVALIVAVVVVEVSPNLSKRSTTIGAYNAKAYATDTIAILKGEAFSTSFDYSGYEPAILVIDVTASDVQSQGYLSFVCNGRFLSSVYVSSDNQRASISAITLAGAEWVKSPSAYTEAYSNQIDFLSDSDTGFEGTFDYQIDLKGTE